jgi:putative ABC transport system ATP-binding protein
MTDLLCPCSDDVLTSVAQVGQDIVRMRDVSFAWPGVRPFALTVDDFSLRRGERLLILGPSGTGKSTFLSLLCGILQPQQGTLSILGTDMRSLSSMRRDRFRAEHFGIIFQLFNLLPYGSVMDNVALPLSFAPIRHGRVMAGGGIEDEARRLLSGLGLPVDDLIHSPVADLSVGQQQRVAAVRALIGRPEMLVVDEPTSALDRASRGAFIELLSAEVRASFSTLLMVSHDEDLAEHFTRVVRLDSFAHGGRANQARRAP